MTLDKGETAQPYRKILAVVLTLLLVVAAGGALKADAESPLTREYQLKAAALYNIAKFIHWPPEAYGDTDAPLIFCVIDASPLAPALEQFSAGKTVQGRIPLIKPIATLDQLVGCQILFIGQSKHASLSQILAALDNTSVLTVGETKDFAERGGIIEFFIANNKLRFAINVDAAQRARLIISAQLLNLANIVRNGREE